MPYYWRARRPEPVQPGFRVPGWDPRGNPEVRRIEEIWEAVREAEFPNRPSRLGAVFVCRKRVGFCGTHSWSEGQVYEVKVRGRVFVANSECFTGAREAASRGDWGRVESWGRQYWAARGSVLDILEEVVVDGTVTVIREAPDGATRRVAQRYLTRASRGSHSDEEDAPQDLHRARFGASGPVR